MYQRKAGTVTDGTTTRPTMNALAARRFHLRGANSSARSSTSIHRTPLSLPVATDSWLAARAAASYRRAA
jgi:hypothetical protein